MCASSRSSRRQTDSVGLEYPVFIDFLEVLEPLDFLVVLEALDFLYMTSKGLKD